MFSRPDSEEEFRPLSPFRNRSLDNAENLKTVPSDRSMEAAHLKASASDNQKPSVGDVSKTYEPDTEPDQPSTRAKPQTTIVRADVKPQTSVRPFGIRPKNAVAPQARQPNARPPKARQPRPQIAGRFPRPPRPPATTRTNVKPSAQPGLVDSGSSSGEESESSDELDPELFNTAFSEKTPELMTPVNLLKSVELYGSSGLSSQYFYLTNAPHTDKFTVAK